MCRPEVLPSPEGVMSCGKFIVLDNMSVLIILLFNSLQLRLNPILSAVVFPDDEGDCVYVSPSTNKTGKRRQITV